MKCSSMKSAWPSILLLCAVAAQALPQTPSSAQHAEPKRKIPCKTPEIADSCYWTHGRLNWANGGGNYRIWKIGTKRIVFVLSGPDAQKQDLSDGEHPELSEPIERAYEVAYRRRVRDHIFAPDLPDPVFADFELCPLEPEHPGWMQAVCIETAKNIFVQPRTK